MIQEQILQELQNPGFPNLELIFSQEALEAAPKLLAELLEGEKQEFEKLIKTDKQDITFELFDDE